MTRERAALGLLAVVIAALPLVVSTAYAFNVLNIIGLYAIVTLGLILLGCSGQVSLGQAAFYGLGAYASALLSRDLGGPRRSRSPWRWWRWEAWRTSWGFRRCASPSTSSSWPRWRSGSS